MSLFESLFYMIWRGLAIGVLISAPMGPVGILCIQRTLDKGRKAGLYTGIGASISDLFYCLLTGFGLSFIEEFLERNSSIIQLAGSLVLIAFGIYLFRKNPTRGLKRPISTEISPHKNILGGFLFTFSNPLIIFLTIGLFARFNFLMPEFKIYHYILGYISILVGALGWWWIVTYFIDKVRTHFNLRSMWLINRIIGAVILVFAVVGIVSAILDMSNGGEARASTHNTLQYRDIYLNRNRGYSTLNTDSMESSVDISVKGASFKLTAKIKSFDMRPWQMRFSRDFSQDVSDATPRHMTFAFIPTEVDDGISISPALKVAVFEDSLKIEEKTIFLNRNLSATHNCIQIRRDGKRWQLAAGVFKLKNLLDFQSSLSVVDSLHIARDIRGKLEVEEIRINIYPESGFCDCSQASPWRDENLLTEYLDNSYDYVEGYWQMIDRSLEESLLRMGGDYKFAIVRSHDGYDLIYLDGASVGGATWNVGDVKAHFSSSGIDNVWNVTWHDSMHQSMSKDINAQLSDNGTITISFPYQNSHIRLIKREKSFLL